ncbi:MAG: 4Fe-4S ferredoxin, partial [Deltaproteobacteria bacterium]|nr:4Fe-4S ferredoxin [Deltaproteobacteria bacterium]
MPSEVFAMDLRTSLQENLYVKLDRLLDVAGFDEIVKERHLIAIKLHFGEKGNTAYIPPTHLRHLVNRVYNLGGKP